MNELTFIHKEVNPTYTAETMLEFSCLDDGIAVNAKLEMKWSIQHVTFYMTTQQVKELKALLDGYLEDKE